MPFESEMIEARDLLKETTYSYPHVHRRVRLVAAVAIDNLLRQMQESSTREAALVSLQKTFQKYKKTEQERAVALESQLEGLKQEKERLEHSQATTKKDIEEKDAAIVRATEKIKEAIDDLEQVRMDRDWVAAKAEQVEGDYDALATTVVNSLVQHASALTKDKKVSELLATRFHGLSLVHREAPQQETVAQAAEETVNAGPSST
ncbi:hypothetical protein HKX48_004753 [Thoreauomyces humboldtii]|nr:hypothetical protein HKX48_004753 [Thoreauomyces humboldtii]